MNVDEFLKQQASASVALRGTIEAVPERSHRVKITPFNRDGRCSCSEAIELDTSDVDDVEPTADLTPCCGKQLRIAIIKIKATARIPIADVLIRPAGRDGGARRPECNPDIDPCCYCNEDYGRCIDSGRPRSQCYRELKRCMADCLNV